MNKTCMKRCVCSHFTVLHCCKDFYFFLNCWIETILILFFVINNFVFTETGRRLVQSETWVQTSATWRLNIGRALISKRHAFEKSVWWYMGCDDEWGVSLSPQLSNATLDWSKCKIGHALLMQCRKMTPMLHHQCELWCCFICSSLSNFL